MNNFVFFHMPCYNDVCQWRPISDSVMWHVMLKKGNAWSEFYDEFSFLNIRCRYRAVSIQHLTVWFWVTYGYTFSSAFLSTKVEWRIPHEVVNHKRQVLSISGLKSNSACLLIPNFHQISITGESTCESIHESITAANLSIKLVKVAAYNGDATDK